MFWKLCWIFTDCGWYLEWHRGIVIFVKYWSSLLWFSVLLFCCILTHLTKDLTSTRWISHLLFIIITLSTKLYCFQLNKGINNYRKRKERFKECLFNLTCLICHLHRHEHVWAVFFIHFTCVNNFLFLVYFEFSEVNWLATLIVALDVDETQIMASDWSKRISLAPP